MKKIIGYILSAIGILVFISLYFLMVWLKDNANVGYIIMVVGYCGVVMFICGTMLIAKNKITKDEKNEE